MCIAQQNLNTLFPSQLFLITALNTQFTNVVACLIVLILLDIGRRHFCHITKDMCSKGVLILSDGTALDVETGEAEHLLLEDGEVLVRQLTHEYLLCESRIAGVLVAILDGFHPAVELIASDVQGLTEVERIEVVFGFIHHHHDVVSRLIVHQQLAVTVGDDTSRGVFYLFQKCVRVGTLLVVVAGYLQLKQSDDVYHHNEYGHSANDIVPVFCPVILHLLLAFENFKGVNEQHRYHRAANDAHNPLQPVEEVEELKRIKQYTKEQYQRNHVYRILAGPECC